MTYIREVPGTVKMYGVATAPANWLLCDGTAVSRTTYADLFAAIGTTFGVGDGSTTFNVPDFRGIFPRGIGSQTISAITYTGVLGTVAGDQMQGHLHVYDKSNMAANRLAGALSGADGTFTSTKSQYRQ